MHILARLIRSRKALFAVVTVYSTLTSILPNPSLNILSSRYNASSIKIKRKLE